MWKPEMGSGSDVVETRFVEAGFVERLHVPLMKYLNTGIKNLYGGLSVRQNFVW